jgi:DNA-binding PadR family transcriptional regulator
MERAFLPTTTYAVLGLLGFGQELSGYEVRQWALRSLRFFFWTPAQSHVYRELRRLEELGLAASRDVPQEGRPDKRVFAITEEGRRELSRWIDEAPLAPPVLKYDSALRLFFGQHARPGRLEEIIDEHRAAVQQTLDELDAVRAVLAAGGPPEDTSEEAGRWAWPTPSRSGARSCGAATSRRSPACGGRWARLAAAAAGRPGRPG